MSADKEVEGNVSQRPEGKLFSSVYVDPGKPKPDSPRMRARLGAMLNDLEPPDLIAMIENRLGLEVRYHNWRHVLEEFELNDVLDIVTLAYMALARARYADRREERYLKQVNAIFRQENVFYEADNLGGVHFSVDKEFAANQAATLATLGSPRYANALHNFEKAQSKLSEVPPNGKDAIRAVFDAAENLFRLMYPKQPSLKAKSAKELLTAAFQRRYEGNAPAMAASSQVVEGFGKWVEACHNYRHEHKGEDVMQPPLDLAVQLVSAGATYIRWLAELDASLDSQNG